LHNDNDPIILDIIKSNVNLKLITTNSYTLSFFKKIIYKTHNKLALIINAIFSSQQKMHFYESLNELIKTFKIDIIHCPYQFIPTIENVKLICTMHDVQELYFPAFFTPDQRAHRAVNYNKYIKNADAIIVSYKHVKEDILNFFQKQESSVHVVLLKMNNLWFKKYQNDSTLDLNFKLPFSKYLLYPANMWIHKNHKNLVEAIKLLKDKGIIINIVFTGDYRSKNGEHIQELIELYHLQNQVKIVGIVSEIELYGLYKNTWGVVIPTLYEAGSFPLVESILMEIPVICSNVTSLPETIGNEDYIFDPRSIQSIADKMEELWTSS
jgi:glycosyltransferase involved in cell wall biosynthesis